MVNFSSITYLPFLYVCQFHFCFTYYYDVFYFCLHSYPIAVFPIQTAHNSFFSCSLNFSNFFSKALVIMLASESHVITGIIRWSIIIFFFLCIKKGAFQYTIVLAKGTPS